MREIALVNISSQHGRLDVGNFGVLQPAQTWLVSHIASDRVYERSKNVINRNRH